MDCRMAMDDEMWRLPNIPKRRRKEEKEKEKEWRPDPSKPSFPWASLPPEILEKIFNHLPIHYLMRCERVSKALRAVVQRQGYKWVNVLSLNVGRSPKCRCPDAPDVIQYTVEIAHEGFPHWPYIEMDLCEECEEKICEKPDGSKLIDCSKARRECLDLFLGCLKRFHQSLVQFHLVGGIYSQFGKKPAASPEFAKQFYSEVNEVISSHNLSFPLVDSFSASRSLAFYPGLSDVTGRLGPRLEHIQLGLSSEYPVGAEKMVHSMGHFNNLRKIVLHALKKDSDWIETGEIAKILKNKPSLRVLKLYVEGPSLVGSALRDLFSNLSPGVLERFSVVLRDGVEKWMERALHLVSRSQRALEGVRGVKRVKIEVNNDDCYAKSPTVPSLQFLHRLLDVFPNLEILSLDFSSLSQSREVARRVGEEVFSLVQASLNRPSPSLGGRKLRVLLDYDLAAVEKGEWSEWEREAEAKGSFHTLTHEWIKEHATRDDLDKRIEKFRMGKKVRKNMRFQSRTDRSIQIDKFRKGDVETWLVSEMSEAGEFREMRRRERELMEECEKMKKLNQMLEAQWKGEEEENFDPFQFMKTLETLLH